MKKFLISAIIILIILISVYYILDSNNEIVKTYYDLTDEEIEDLRNDSEISNVTVNDDGSVDITTSISYLEYNQRLYYSELEEYIEEEYLNNTDYSNILEIKMSDDLTSFEVYANTDEITFELVILAEDLLVNGLFCNELFSIEKETPEIYVTFFNSNNETIASYDWTNFYKKAQSIIKDHYMSYLQSFIDGEIEDYDIVMDVNISDDMTSFEVYFDSNQDELYEVLLAQELISISTDYYELFVDSSDEIPEIYVKIFDDSNQLTSEYNSSNIDDLYQEIMSKYFSDDEY